jgi:hypothetical protein
VELERVEGEEADDAADEWLFESQRDYLEQLAYYKKHKGYEQRV